MQTRILTLATLMAFGGTAFAQTPAAGTLKADREAAKASHKEAKAEHRAAKAEHRAEKAARAEKK